MIVGRPYFVFNIHAFMKNTDDHNVFVVQPL